MWIVYTQDISDYVFTIGVFSDIIIGVQYMHMTENLV